MAGEKPVAAMVLSIIGGLLILLAGGLLLAIADIFTEGLPFLLLISGETFAMDDAALAVLVLQILGTIGIVIGIIIIVGGVMMYSKPASSTLWGVIILLLSLVSIVATGGLILGLILGLIGGVLGIAFKPMAPATPVAAPPPAVPAPELEGPSTESGEQ